MPVANPEDLAVKKPAWVLHKKGEIMNAKDWWDKYYFMSQKNLRDSHQTVLIGRIKAYEKVARIRGKDPEESDTGKPPSEWSDTSSKQSMFRGSNVKKMRKQLPGSKSMTSLARESPEITAICGRIGKLIETDTVQKCCNVRPVQGTKYLFYGGGCPSETFRRNSIEDPWEYPKPRWGGCS